MKQLVSTKFVRALRTASQTGANIDAQVLENDYDDFVKIVFSHTNGVASHNTLSYTRLELSSLAKVSEKKSFFLSKQSHRTGW